MMKHLTPYGKFTDVHYTLYERVSKQTKIFESLEQDVEDIFLELRDDGYDVEVYRRVPVWSERNKQGKELLSIDISRDRLFNWSGVKDYFGRSLWATSDNFKLSKIVLQYYSQGGLVPDNMKSMKSQVFSGSAWNYFRQFVSDSDFVESNMIYGISFILEVV